MVFVKISSLHPLVLLALAGCLGNGHHSESGGTAWDPVPASQVDSVEVVQFGHSYAAIFPAGYRVPVRGTRRFTPSPALIRDIEPRVREQFRDALINQVERQLNDPTSYGGPLSAEDRERLWKAHLKGINRLTDRYPQLYRQYAGYYSESGERMLAILFIDFRKDPHDWRPHIADSWVAGWHGWYETSLTEMTYNLDLNKLVY
jgi:hypothetical protein